MEMSSAEFDNYGVPTFYMNVAIAEPAGGGNVRVWNCARRHGTLVPVCEMIIPAADLVVALRSLKDTATEVFTLEQSVMGGLAMAN